MSENHRRCYERVDTPQGTVWIDPEAIEMAIIARDGTKIQLRTNTGANVVCDYLDLASQAWFVERFPLVFRATQIPSAS